MLITNSPGVGVAVALYIIKIDASIPKAAMAISKLPACCSLLIGNILIMPLIIFGVSGSPKTLLDLKVELSFSNCISPIVFML